MILREIMLQIYDFIQFPALLIAGFLAYKRLKIQIKADKENIQKKFQYQNTKDNLPVLLKILEDLEILTEAFSFDGRFSPSIEHKCPKLSENAGDNPEEISYAERRHQFYQFGRRIVENCKKIIFLTAPKHLPEIVKICKEIKVYLFSKGEGKKTNLELMTNKLIGSLPNPESIKIAEDFQIFIERLEEQIEAELPYLALD